MVICIQSLDWHRITFFAALCVTLLGLATGGMADAPSRPNVLWIVTEDVYPYFGCYGDPVANAPKPRRIRSGEPSLRQRIRHHSDLRSATRHARHAHVCRPLGVEHICNQKQDYNFREGEYIEVPDFVRFYSEYLHETGYYCTNTRHDSHESGAS